MTTDTLLDRLGEARKQCNEAKKQIAQAKTKMARRGAEEELNWWQGKASYLESCFREVRQGDENQ